MKRTCPPVLPALLLASGAWDLASAAVTAIESDRLVARWDEAAGRLELSAKPSQRAFLKDARLGVTGGAVRTATQRHPVLGEGRALVIAGPDGGRASVTLYPGLPFALVRSVFRNSGASTNNVREAEVLSGVVDAGGTAVSLKALGTAGLTGVDKHPGSYVFLALADPDTRRGVVGAWLTHDRGSGVVSSGIEGTSATLRARTDYGRLLLAPGAETEGEVFAIGWFDDARVGLEQWADLVARHYGIRLPPQPDGYCTWYSSPHGGASDQQRIVELAEFAARELQPFGFRFVQIDDKWQDGQSKNGPNKVFVRHSPRGPYPDGMRPVAERIAKLGLTPGLWFMPFAGTHADPFFADKQSWFARGADGTPYETSWGGTALDMTHPEARAYLADVSRRIAKEWGYAYFKMDGLWVGTASKLLYVNNGYAPDDLGEPLVHDPMTTPIEAYREGLRTVREAAGKDVFLLGCCVAQNMRSFGGAFGLVDAMRIGPDNGASWDGIRRGPWHASNRYFLHGRIWYNDPDPVYVRPGLPIEQARAICSWVALSGTLNVSSDWLPGLPPERLDILKRILPSHGLPARPVDLFEADLPALWLLSDDRADPPRHVLGVFNWDGKKPLRITRSLAGIGLPASGVFSAFDFWAGRFLPPVSGGMDIEVPPASCRVIALRPAGAEPRVVSTSRHVTQGMVDVIGEQWNAEKGELRGRCRMVAGDAYEVRVAVPVGETSWEATGGMIDGGLAAPLEVRQNGPEVRATVRPVATGEVAWTLRFRGAPVRVPPPTTPAGLHGEAGPGCVRLAWNADDAIGYRILRSDGVTSSVSSAEFSDVAVERGGSYEYRVQGRSWSGDWSHPAMVTVQMPAKLVLPPRPPAPTVHLSDLKPLESSTGWGAVRMNRSVEDKPLTLGGKVFDKGMGVHADSLLAYAVPAGAKRFVAVAGLDDEKKDDERSSVVFKVFGDVKEMGEPPVLLAESPRLDAGGLRAWHFDVELSDRVKGIRLVVEDAGDGIAADHADWAEAGFVK